VKKIISILVVSSSILFHSAQAANDYTTYIGLGFGSGDADDGEVEFEIDAGLIRLGIMPTENTALEYRFGVGVSDDAVDGITYEMENVYGVYGLYHYDISLDASVYALAGFSQVSIKSSFGNASAQDEERGISYGFGVAVYDFNVEYVQYLDTSDLEVGAVAVGYTYKFE